MKKVFIIAEAGVNHNGSMEKAMEMIKVAKEAGADAVKFQTAIPELVMTKNVEKAEYQKKATGEKQSQLEMAKKIHLSLDKYKILQNECERIGIEFMSTPFDEVSIELLQTIDVNRFKIPSGEITNLPFLRKIALTGKPIIMSTGMSNLKEVEIAFKLLVSLGTKKEYISILHCTTDYPANYRDVNLNAMATMSKKFKVDVGYSDHTSGTEVAIAATALGANIIEKHFTLDCNLPGPDHSASLEPGELKQMISSIRNIEAAMGHGKKVPCASEKKNINIIRRSIVAKKHINKGEIFTADNLICKRPGSGVSPWKWDEVLGRKSNKNYLEDDLIEV